MASAFVATLDKREQDRLLARFAPGAVERVMEDAARSGANAAAKVMRDRAPIGRSDRPSQYYRAHGLGHGTFRKSVRAAKIRGRRAALRGLQGRTIGFVIGPMGRNAFTRHWRERDTGWTAQAADPALDAARRESVSELTRYGRG